MSLKTSPITCAQQGVYLDCVIDPENLSYNNPYSVLIPGGVLPGTVAESVQRYLSVILLCSRILKTGMGSRCRSMLTDVMRRLMLWM